jgi:hypothetical protein
MTISDFLRPANSSLDVKTLLQENLTQKQEPNPLTFIFRDMLLFPPQLGKNQTLPKEYALEPGESALSLTPHRNYTYCKAIDLYVLTRHIYLMRLALTELSDEETLHGQKGRLKNGCSGPICRRARREDRAESLVFQRNRLTRSPNSFGQSRYRRIKTSRPSYAAVEPMLTAFTAEAYKSHTIEAPNEYDKLMLSLHSKDRLVAHLRDKYGKDAFQE